MTMNDDLVLVYGDRASVVEEGLQRLMSRYATRLHRPEGLPGGRRRWAEHDAVLITYADSVQRPGQAPLATLRQVLPELVGSDMSTVHLLPFYPWTSDDGFSVVDYLSVDPQVGTWDDVTALAADIHLMFDAVINHVSSRSTWFQGFLADDERYRDWFITVPEGSDTSAVVRPRTLPLLTRFDTARGPELVWTTFSADQIDLNYASPSLFLAVAEVLLEYVARGASVLRLDAITYLYKQLGTSCVHLPQTHAIARVIRALLDEVAPWVTIITETNVPHAENISYFGNGHDEAQMVYNFALPPLVLHSFISQDTQALSTWSREMTAPSESTCMFNFLASHDGVGVRGAEGILSDDELRALATAAETRGGLVGYRSIAGGADMPYELNINYFDALNGAGDVSDLELQVARFLTAHSIMLTLPGVPGIYIHSLIGSRGWPEGVERTGMNRSINREKLDADQLLAEVADADGRRGRILAGMRRMLQVRGGQDAFAPHAEAAVVETAPSLFMLRRRGSQGWIRCVHNVTPQAQSLDEPAEDLLSGEIVSSVPPFGHLWLREGR